MLSSRKYWRSSGIGAFYRARGLPVAASSDRKQGTERSVQSKMQASTRIPWYFYPKLEEPQFCATSRVDGPGVERVSSNR